ncbi:MAG: diguanylate cyclase [Firmicutes bacterium]|nr:diguanylate cyclase [Bacillota bacterium]
MKRRLFLARVDWVIFSVMLLVAVSFLETQPALALERQDLDLTLEEVEYIANNPEVNSLVVVGAAPIQYMDKNGEVQGISKLILEEIAAATGLRFNCLAFDSLEQLRAVAQDGDIVVGIPQAYADAIPGLVLSRPYLTSVSIQFQHKSVDPEKLDGKIFAAVEGGNIPSGIPAGSVRYFDTREEAMAAVNAGTAHYGYGNAYSVAYYTLQNGYRNLVTVPLEREQREYCLAPINPDPLLMSILNKALAEIDNDTILSIILSSTTRMDQELTWSKILDTYKGVIWALLVIVIILLLLLIFFHRRGRKELELQNRRYAMLAELSNEFIFHYCPEMDTLSFSQHSIDSFGENIARIAEVVKATLTQQLKQRQTMTGSNISNDAILPPIPGCNVTFRLVTSPICTDDGELREILGKLIDVSKELAEKEALVTRAQLDGLTGVLNAVTIRELVEERLSQKSRGILDAFIILDADNFKKVNDTLGHYAGDQVLKGIANTLSSIFRATDIIGRFGGDEFCIYMKNVPSPEFLHNKCRQLVNATRRIVGDVIVSTCAGAVLVRDKRSYEEVFQAADSALYQAKAEGPGQVVVLTCAKNTSGDNQ